MTEASAAPAKPKLYDRLKQATKRRLAEPILALIVFLEAMIIPIFAEIMLAPVVVTKLPAAAWRLATICTVASVTGSLAGYAIGCSCSTASARRSSISTAPATASPR